MTNDEREITDEERLDWLERHAVEVRRFGDGWDIVTVRGAGRDGLPPQEFPLREAIDRAMRAGGG